jgi:plasmid stabilization system protein ParE
MQILYNKRIGQVVHRLTNGIRFSAIRNYSIFFNNLVNFAQDLGS